MFRKRCTAFFLSLALVVGLCGTGIAGMDVQAEELDAVTEAEEADPEDKTEASDVSDAAKEPADLPDKNDADETQAPESPADKEEAPEEKTEQDKEEPDQKAEEVEKTEKTEGLESAEQEADKNTESRTDSGRSVSKELHIAIGAVININSWEYQDIYGYFDENYTAVFDDGQFASIDGNFNLKGIKVGRTVLHLIEENEWGSNQVDIPVRVTNPVVSKTNYEVYQCDNVYKELVVKIAVKNMGANCDFEFDYGASSGNYIKDTKLSKGYFTVGVYESGKAVFRVDGKKFTVKIKIVKAELSASNTISKNLKSLVTYRGKKDNLILKLGGKKKNAVSWKSTNKKAAVVNQSGRVTGKGRGRAYIRAYLKDGSYVQYLVECTYKGAYQAVKNGFHDLIYGDGKNYKVIKYSQPKRMNKGYRDCSSFVSRCYYDTTLNRRILKIGDIQGNYASTASYQAKWLHSKGKTVANRIVNPERLLPGDTMYTSGGPSYKYDWRNIYHAFLYVGNGCVISTYGSGSKETLYLLPYNYDGYNVVYIGRPFQKPVKTKSITLSKKSITLGVKEKYTLKASKKPSNCTELSSWKSSDKKIAAVSGGVITAKKKGTAYITVKSGSCTRKCKVIVKPAPKKISLNAAKKTLKVKQTFQIRPKLPKGTASNKIRYTSSNSRTASVSAEGKITAKKAGTAVITAVTHNNKKAVIEITVL